MDYGISGNAALTIASSSGLGKASATALAKEGVNVVINGRDPEKLEAAVEEIREVAAGEVVGKQGDITDPADVSALVETTVSEFGGLNHLVTSTGGPARRRFEETSDDDWYQAFDLIVMSVVRTIQGSIPHLREDGGTIVCITSRRTKEATPTNVLSSAIRMCIPGIMKCLSYDLAPDVRINTVRPGAFKTPRNPPKSWDEKRTGVPLGRVGEPREFGDAVAYLSSERSSYLTGASIPVDGGSNDSTI